MSHSTEKQISFIGSLARKAGFESSVAAVTAYGWIKSPSSLTVGEASQVIEWLKDGGEPVKASPASFGDGAAIHHGGITGTVITAMADGRCIVKYHNGRVLIAAGDELTAI